MLSMGERVLFLKGVALFADLPGRELTQVAEVARLRTFSANAVLMREGEIGDFLYLIVEGEASVSAEAREVARRGCKDCIGELSVLDAEPRTATVTALTDMVVLEVRRDDFRYLMAERAEVTRGIIRTLVRKLAEANAL